MKNKNIPAVIFDKLKLRNAVSQWFGIKKDSEVEHKIGLLLIQLGFSSTDTVRLFNYDEKNNSFSYSVNGFKVADINDRIRLFFSQDDSRGLGILLSRDNFKVKYNCERKLNGQIDLDLITPIFYELNYSNGTYYRRTLANNTAKYLIKSSDYSLELSFAKNNYGETVLTPLNEDKLEEYLSNLIFPLNIDFIYKNICELSLGDVSDYTDFSLKVSKFEDKFGEYELTDSIVFKKGNLVEYITSGKKSCGETPSLVGGKIRKKDKK